MATATVTPAADAPASRLRPPLSLHQATHLARYQLREYYRSMRFVVLLGIVLGIGAILTTLVAHFRGGLVSSGVAFYGSFWGGGINVVVVLSAVFFGGDAIAGEFQNKTGYFLMGLPLRRATVYVGKFIAAFLASTAMMLVFLAILVGNGGYYFHAGLFPWQLGIAVVLAFVYLGAVLGATFLFSSLFKSSLYGFVLTLVMFLFGFTILQDLIIGLVKTQPWMIISYASSTIANVFSPPVNWGLSATVTPERAFMGGPVVGTSYAPGIAEGVVIMLGYLVITAIAGLWLFEREEFS
jgi:ABC-2 type transport system permease protein